jgi:hypothetical protein
MMASSRLPTLGDAVLDNAPDDAIKSSSAMSYRVKHGVRMRLRACLLSALLLAGGILIIFLFAPVDFAYLAIALAALLVLTWIIRFYVRAVVAFYYMGGHLPVQAEEKPGRTRIEGASGILLRIHAGGRPPESGVGPARDEQCAGHRLRGRDIDNADA